MAYSGKVDGRDEERGDEARAEDGGRGGKGEAAVAAKSRVAMSSVLTTGFPQEEQKRVFEDSSVPQKTQLGMEFSRYSLNQRSDFGP